MNVNTVVMVIFAALSIFAAIFYMFKEIRNAKIFEENAVMFFFAFPFIGLAFILKTGGWFNTTLAVLNSILDTTACYFSMKPMFRYIKITYGKEEPEKMRSMVHRKDERLYLFFMFIAIGYVLFFGLGILLRSNFICRIPQIIIFAMTTGSLLIYLRFLLQEKIFTWRDFQSNVLFPAWLISFIEVVNFVWVVMHYGQYSDWTKRNSYPIPMVVQIADTVWIVFCLVYYFIGPRYLQKKNRKEVE